MYACFTRQPITKKNDLSLIDFSLRFSEGQPCPATLNLFDQAASGFWNYGEKRLTVDYQQVQNMLRGLPLPVAPQIIYEFEGTQLELASQVVIEHLSPNLVIAYRNLPPLKHHTLEKTQYIFYHDSECLKMNSLQVSSLLPYNMRHIVDHVQTPDQAMEL